MAAASSARATSGIWYAWRGVMPALAEEHTVIAPDLRGIGESSLEEPGYDREAPDEYVRAYSRPGWGPP